jgi:hypothetical protein
MEVDLAKLGRYIADHCDRDQLEMLCTELRLSEQELLGDTHSARAFDLVSLARDRPEGVALLLAAVARITPDAFTRYNFKPAAQPRERQRVRGWGVLVGAALACALLVGAGLVRFFVLRDRGAATSAPTPTLLPVGVVSSPTVEPTPTPVALEPPTATVFWPTTPPTQTPAPAPLPTETPTPFLPTAATTATDTPGPTVTPTPSATPVAPAGFPAWAYDPASRTLAMPPGDGGLGRARLCTPLNAYHGVQAVYLIDRAADQIGVSLPAQGRVTHTGASGGEPIVRTLDVLRHPNSGEKVNGELADFTGCDLLVSQEVRQLLGFPLELGEFNAAARFDHGWVRIELLAGP